jgi:hypothetical protein
VGLHSGASCSATLLPARAGDGRYFVLEGDEAKVAAEVGNVESQSQLCTTLRRGDAGGPRVRTVEHLLSAMEALGVDNCRIEVSGGAEVCSFFLDCNWQLPVFYFRWLGFVIVLSMHDSHSNENCCIVISFYVNWLSHDRFLCLMDQRKSG